MKRAIRTSNINIDTIVPDGLQWVNASIQSLEIREDGSVASVSARDSQLHRRIDRVATEIVTIQDPVTGKATDISVAGIGTSITSIMVKWMLEDNPDAYYDESAGRVILNGTR